jgi:arylsulfatase A-like enzyme
MVEAEPARPNVLFIAIDDLNDWVGCLAGHPQVQTPQLDALAKRGTVFTNAHCQSPLCNSSRSSLLTGLRPSTTGIYGLAPGIRSIDATRDRVTLPQLFTASGYHTYTCGKIYHDGSIKPQDRDAEFNTWGPAPGPGRGGTPIAKLPQPRHPLMDWGAWPPDDQQSAHGDYKIADAAIDALQNAPQDKPFFIACGFRQPHVPCYAPPAYFDIYPADSLKLPPVKDDDRADLPKFADFLHWRLPEPRLATLKEYDEWQPLVRAYLAATSFMDAQLGRVLAALEASGRADNTIVVVWSDHGWHLGEKGITGKNTLWERSTRVPLVFAGPGVAADARCAQPVELLDIYPTLAQLCGLKAPEDLEGHSLAPQLSDAAAKREHPAITTHNQGNHAIRTLRWRYIRYADGSEELYDMEADPHEWTNLAENTEHAATKRDLARWLPKVDMPPAPGSAHRILTYDQATGDVVWEGKKIDTKQPLPGP